MRTTVNIDDQLLDEAKVVAARSRRSLGAVIDDALRVMLSTRDAHAVGRRRIVVPTSGSGGLRPGVDLEDREGLADVLEENEPAGASG